MSEFFKSKYKLGLALSAIFMAVTLAVGSFAFIDRDMETVIASAGSKAEDPKSLELDDEPELDPELEAEYVDDEPEIVSFNAPAEMRGTFLVPGVDFLKSKDTTEATIKSEIDGALASAKELDLNAVIVDTVYGDQVIYSTKDAPELSRDFDILAYILERAREQDMYTYAIFDASMYESRSSLTSALAIGAGMANKLSANLGEFAAAYSPDGILIDGYASKEAGGSYSDYVFGGGGIGFDNFMRQSPAAVVKTASGAVRKAAPGVQVGLLADAVWENSSVNEEGSATTASYTSLSGGYADTKSFVEKGLVDFVAVKAYTTTESQSEPFTEVVSWWAGLTRQNDIPLYVVLATGNLFSTEPGWGSADQLIRQISTLEEVGGVRGSIFNNLQKVSSNNQNITANLQKLSKNEVAPEQILTQLEMTKPAQRTFTTSDPQLTFTGASDPGEPVTINGEEVKTDASGYFTVQMPLKTGLNNFTVKHKDKTVEYAVTRKVQVLKSASPMDNITTEGGMSITVSAVAYQDAKVYAVMGGSTVTMSVDDSVEDEQDRDGFFRTFTGQFTAPASTGEVQNLGNITVYAEYDGEKDSIQAASVKVNKKARLEDGVAVRVVAEQAITYPPNTLDNIPDARYYPLPAGAMDYAVGDEIIYKKEGKTYGYFVLASGLRVASQDITAISDDYPSNNVISGLSVTSESGFTYVTLKTAQKVSYSVSYASSGISFEFNNTAQVPAGMTLSKNPIFTGASWSGTTLTLAFAKSNGFMGYKGYYDDGGNLVLRFNNPPSSISGARIAIDPGHGGGDVGASGFLSDYPESAINRLLAEALAAELESRGATVNLMNNSGIEGEQRKQAAEKWNADLFVSIHCNSAPNINATGSEVYYFHPFSKTLAANTSSGASSGLSSNNRGAKQSYYHVTLSSQMPSVLIETGFFTNKSEYEKLIKSKYHKSIAAGIADGISGTIKSHYTGVSTSGSESVGNTVDPGTESGADTQPGSSSSTNGGTSGSIKAQAVYIDSNPNVILGVNTQLWPEFYPDEVTDNAVTWKSSDSSVVEVDEAGRIFPKKEGSADVTITTKNGGEQSVSRVNVQKQGTKQTKLTKLELNKTDVVLSVGEAYILRPLFTPESASNKQVTFRSSSGAVASVDDTGKITAVKEGSTTITATSKDGSIKATCTVTVAGVSSSGSSTTPAADSGVSISGARSLQTDDYYYELTINTNMRLIVYNESLSVIRGADFTWKTDDSSVVSVDNYGNITAKKEGSAIITATPKGHNSEQLEWHIDVTKNKVALRNINIDTSELESSKVTVKKGESITLKVEYSPLNATNRTLVWSSSNTKYATVDGNGKVTGVNRGTVTITVKSKDDSKIYDTIDVEVLSSTGASSSGTRIEEFYILYDGYDVDDIEYFSMGDTGKLTYQCYPEDANTSGVTWESKNPAVVEISSNGNFKCLKSGTATIMIKDGSRLNKTFKIVVK